MADEEQNEDAVAEDNGTGGKKSKTLLIIIIVATLALAGGGGGAYILLKDDTSKEEVAGAEGEEGEEGEGEDEVEEEKPATPYYFSLNPPFVVNFVGKGRAKFLQVNVDGLTRDPSVKEDITTHLPQIRNNIVFILSSKRHEDLVTQEGKEDLRKQVLEEVRSILNKETGNGDVEDIYFTSFVIQ